MDLVRAEFKVGNTLLELISFITTIIEIRLFAKPFYLPQTTIIVVVEDEADSVIRFEVAA